MPDLYGFSVKGIDGTDQRLGDYRGKVLLVVNVASECGLTPQDAGLQELHAQYAPRGFAVLGFPCNQFGGQEPGSDADVYSWLTSQSTRPDGPGDITWNFAKFVVDRTGSVVARFDPSTTPAALELRAVIQKALDS